MGCFERRKHPRSSSLPLSLSLSLFPFHSTICSAIQYVYLAIEFVGVRVGRSEANHHGYGTEAYRDRAGARKHHHVSVCVCIIAKNIANLRTVIFQRVAECHWFGCASKKTGAPHREEFD